MPNVVTRVVVLVGLAGSTVVAAEDAASRIAPFLGSRTVAVGHVDVSKVDVDGLLDLYESAGETIPESTRKRVGMLVTGFLASGANEVFVLGGWDDVPVRRNGFPFTVVIPAPAGDAALAALESLVSSDTLEFARFRGAVVLGHEAAVERLHRLKPSPRPDLQAGLRSTGKATARLVLATGPDERRVLQALLPDFPAPLGGRVRELLPRINWLALSGNVPPQRELRIVTSLPDEATAESMAPFQRDVLKVLGELELDDEWPSLRELVDAIELERDGSRVTLSLAKSANVKQLMASLVPPAERARRELNKLGEVRKLRQIALAFHNYHDVHRTFPPRASRDGDGKPLLSWRVHVLPYVGELKLYERFRLDEPWDSDHNKALIPEMPAVYNFAGGKPGHTIYALPVGKGTVAESLEPTGFRNVTDGTSNTILAAAVAPKSAVVWTKPDDWRVDTRDPRKGLVPEKARVFTVVFCDGSVHRLPVDIDVAKLKGLLTMAGGETVILD